jgi:hypothetical protein
VECQLLDKKKRPVQRMSAAKVRKIGLDNLDRLLKDE